MARKIKRKYIKNFRIGIKIEIPTKLLSSVDLQKLYKRRFSSDVIQDINIDFDVCPIIHDEMIRARSSEDICKGTSNFSIMLNLGNNLYEAQRLVQILNIIGDGRIIRERARLFVSGKSMLNHLPELVEIKEVLSNISSILPNFLDHAWLNAPDAKLL